MNKFLRYLQHSWLSENVIKTLPMFISLNIAAVSIWQLGISDFAMPLMLGIIAGGLVDLDNSLIGRAKNLIISLVAFSLSSIGASVSLHLGWLFVPVAVVCTFLLVMLGAIGQRYSTIAFGTLIVAVYNSLAYTPEVLWYHNVVMILLGTLLYGLVGILVYLIFPNRTVQENLASAYLALSHYLLAKSAYFDPDDDDLAAKQLALAKANSEVMAAFDKTRVALFYRLSRQHKQQRTQRMLRYYFTAQDILERASSSHYQYHELFQQLSNSDLMFRFQRVLELQAAACQKIAMSLRHREVYEHGVRGEKALQGLLNSLNYHQERGLKSAYRWRAIAENLGNIERQLAQIEQGSSSGEHIEPLSKNFTKSHRLIAENITGLSNISQAIKAHLTFESQLFRHAVRLSIVVLLCSAIVPILGFDSKGYWILLTAIFVCQPNYTATKTRLIQRVIGTIFGVLVGGSFELFNVALSLEAQLGLIVLTGSLYTFFRLVHYGFSTFYITVLVMISLDIAGVSLESGILMRMLDTLLGTAIAWLAVAFLWPDWKYLNLQRNLHNGLKASGQYLRHIIAQLQFGYNEQLPYRIARRDVHNHLSALSNAITNMYSEPQKYANDLTFAPKLLGIAYTLLGYISTLGAYRIASREINQQVDFSAMFFSHAREVANIIGQIASESRSFAKLSEKLTAIDQDLTQFEQENQQKQNDLALVLIQQLRLIVQLLPQLNSILQLKSVR
ncbi:TPA: TIGR01666 family membrane protein [Mannheimia haemolytica]|uniref:TIGR01666 family membrane protein n=1 Tax=Mannheimia haemolytica TaxID=75985 RepID=A0A547EP33_MANHA|nr:YccS family putative transporter [Mannheimia haemolytica]AWW72387.1 TIGR01666 family membrane protein [Pasteurellaceae bacterium 12565]AGI33702.2 TIGR01666 family membrane protein [Mannheimia haemolytica USDA-ARS-USMARC-183]AGK01386.1 putative YccS-like inner membrane protein [Mannheimia haemolytica M42548]AGQ26216.1 membrane protein [Mannheimia haemolytica D153]AGQ41771.1 membrane protein [Mannheimia haemolytica D174]